MHATQIDTGEGQQLGCRERHFLSHQVVRKLGEGGVTGGIESHLHQSSAVQMSETCFLKEKMYSSHVFLKTANYIF